MAVVYNCKGCNKFFDSSKYESCPFCGMKVGEGATETVPTESKKTSKGGLFNFKKEKKEVVVYNMDNVGENLPTECGTWGAFVGSDGKVEQVGAPAPAPAPVSAPIVQTPAVQTVAQEPKQEYEEVEVNEPTFNVTPSVVEDEKKEEANETSSFASSFNSAMATSAKMDDEKTSGFFKINAKKADDASSSSAPNSNVVEMNDEPVCGWLVGISGPYFGQSLKIFAGRNSVGRNPGNHIIMSADKGVSREKHLWITFEPMKKEFFIQAGDSSGLTYLNDEVVMETKKLAAFDTIGIGSGKFKFVPLCGENFSWEDYID